MRLRVVLCQWPNFVFHSSSKPRESLTSDQQVKDTTHNSSPESDISYTGGLFSEVEREDIVEDKVWKGNSEKSVSEPYVGKVYVL